MDIVIKMNMSKPKFDTLTFQEKAQLVFFESGKFISSRDYYNQKLVLYDLGEFFADVWYESESNQIFKIEAIEPGDKRIDRYIESETNNL